VTRAGRGKGAQFAASTCLRAGALVFGWGCSIASRSLYPPRGSRSRVVADRSATGGRRQDSPSRFEGRVASSSPAQVSVLCWLSRGWRPWLRPEGEARGRPCASRNRCGVSGCLGWRRVCDLAYLSAKSYAIFLARTSSNAGAPRPAEHSGRGSSPHPWRRTNTASRSTKEQRCERRTATMRCRGEAESRTRVCA